MGRFVRILNQFNIKDLLVVVVSPVLVIALDLLFMC